MLGSRRALITGRLSLPWLPLEYGSYFVVWHTAMGMQEFETSLPLSGAIQGTSTRSPRLWAFLSSCVFLGLEVAATRRHALWNTCVYVVS